MIALVKALDGGQEEEEYVDRNFVYILCEIYFT